MPSHYVSRKRHTYVSHTCEPSCGLDRHLVGASCQDGGGAAPEGEQVNTHAAQEKNDEHTHTLF